ncbi:MAG: DUF695 domain-containing protein [Lutimonas sp.]
MISVTLSLFRAGYGQLLLALVFFTTSKSVFAQDQWIDFIVDKDTSVLSVSMDLKYYVQKPNYKNLLIVGTQFRPCMKNGFPVPDSLDGLFSFSDSTAAVINRVTRNELVGILTYKCLAFDVYYVKDSVGIRDSLETMMGRGFENSKLYLTLKRDKNWEYYFTKLLPDNLSEDFLIDQEYLNNLVLRGDDLQGLRKVRHWLYFNKLKQRLKMTEKLQSLKFSIDSIDYHRESKYPYELQVSRMDSITPKKISQLTTMMKVLSQVYQAQYDGWGTEVVPKE